MAAGDVTQGKRRYPDEDGQAMIALKNGEYGKDKDGHWWARAPRGHLGSLENHDVTEHEDGTITVSPSILNEGVWHGYLERGVWREV